MVRFTEPVRGSDGRFYRTQACGRIAEDGLWEGWLEFEGDGRTLRTARETEQPNHRDLMYWAHGLTMAYLEGGLERALRLAAAATPADRSDRPRFDGPSRGDRAVVRPPVQEPRAILDPFAVFAEGEDILRRQLRALSRDQLLNIIEAYHLEAAGDTNETRGELADEIVRVVSSAGRRPIREAEATGEA